MSGTNSVISEGLQGMKLGVVALFGIVVPGIWFWAASLFYLTYSLGGESLADVAATFHNLSFAGPYAAWTIGFVVIYVTGSVLRILPPDTPDSWSLRKVRARDTEARIEWPDRFPYRSLPTYLRTRGLRGLAAMVPWDTGEDGKRTPLGLRSKTFLHFVKLFITLHNPSLANHLARQEAFIRLLSGVFYGAFLSGPVFVVGLVAQRSWNQLACVSLGIVVFNCLVVYGVLHAFHYQRLRELVMVLSAYFLIGPSSKSPYNEPDAET